MQEKILFIVCTHGNEHTPLTAIKNVIKKMGKEEFSKKCEYIIANPKAKELGTRFTDVDLNRIYPGDINSVHYESRRAVEILEYAKNFKYVIDLHTTKSDTGIFILVTKGKKENYELAQKLSPKRVVIWESTSGSLTGPVCNFLNSSLEIEASTLSDTHIQDLESSILSVIDNGISKIEEKEWYRVVTSMPIKDVEDIKKLKEFGEVIYNNKKMYALLVGAYKDKACYLMEKIGNPLL